MRSCMNGLRTACIIAKSSRTDGEWGPIPAETFVQGAKRYITSRGWPPIDAKRHVRDTPFEGAIG